MDGLAPSGSSGLMASTSAGAFGGGFSTTSGPTNAVTNSSGLGLGDDGFSQKERDQATLTSAAFDALERDFKEVLDEVRDAALSAYSA